MGKWVSYDLTLGSSRKPREHFTQILLRLSERAALNPLIQSIHVFGSYARGALTCGDIDLTVETTYRIPRNARHRDPTPSRRLQDPTEVAVRTLTRGFRGVEICFISTPGRPDPLPESWGVTPALVWSCDQPDAAANLAQIKPDPAEGRYLRDHFIEVKRTGSDLTVMERVMGLLQQGALRLSVHPFPERVWFPERWHRNDGDRISDEVERIRPVAYDWLLQRGVVPYGQRSTRIFVSSYAVLLGNIDLNLMLWFLGKNPHGEVCLIPHLKKGVRPEMYVFKNGGT
jgi:hypothetical protein